MDRQKSHNSANCNGLHIRFGRLLINIHAVALVEFGIVAIALPFSFRCFFLITVIFSIEVDSSWYIMKPS